MNAGLPGTGIGGLFYIATALWMPVHRIYRRGARNGRGWRRIGNQFGIAVGILRALGATGWLLGVALALPLRDASPGGGAAAAHAARIFHLVALVGTVGILGVVLLSVELAGVVARGRTRNPTRSYPVLVTSAGACDADEHELTPALLPGLADVA
jgi:hypothetical protein